MKTLAALLCLLVAAPAFAQVPNYACASWQPGCVQPPPPAPQIPPPSTIHTTTCYPTGDGPSPVVCTR